MSQKVGSFTDFYGRANPAKMPELNQRPHVGAGTFGGDSSASYQLMPKRSVATPQVRPQ